MGFLSLSMSSTCSSLLFIINLMTVTSFANTNWDWSTDVLENHMRQFTSIDTTITLYTNNYFPYYVSWLAGSASNYVTTSSPLTSNDLTNFNSKIASYEGWAINIYSTHKTISKQGQAASLCLYRQ